MRRLVQRLELILQRPWLARSLARRFAGDAARLAALTFDDGPEVDRTPQLVAALRRLGVRATFFLIGCHAVEHPDIVRELVAAGMEIGTHTMTHRRLSGLPFDVQMGEIAGGIHAVNVAGQVRTALFRPPFGDYDDTTLAVLAALGQKLVLWNVDPREWIGARPARIARRVAAHAGNPAVIVMHDRIASTTPALSGIVPPFRWAGYRFVTISELP